MLSEFSNQAKDSQKLLKTNSTNVNMLKTMLPYLSKQNSPILDKMVSTMEINQLINDYKFSCQTIKANQIADLKKETINKIKINMNDNKKYLADVLLKFMEINEILKMKEQENEL